MFRDLDSVNWVPKRTLDKITENHIRFCFNYTKVNFHYPDNISDFNSLIENFQSENTNIVDDNSYKIFGEKKLNKLIVMDGVSGLSKIRIYLSVYF